MIWRAGLFLVASSAIYCAPLALQYAVDVLTTSEQRVLPVLAGAPFVFLILCVMASILAGAFLALRSIRTHFEQEPTRWLIVHGAALLLHMAVIGGTARCWINLYPDFLFGEVLIESQRAPSRSHTAYRYDWNFLGCRAKLYARDRGKLVMTLVDSADLNCTNERAAMRWNAVTGSYELAITTP